MSYNDEYYSSFLVETLKQLILKSDYDVMAYVTSLLTIFWSAPKYVNINITKQD